MFIFFFFNFPCLNGVTWTWCVSCGQWGRVIGPMRSSPHAQPAGSPQPTGQALHVRWGWDGAGFGGQTPHQDGRNDHGVCLCLCLRDLPAPLPVSLARAVLSFRLCLSLMMPHLWGIFLSLPRPVFLISGRLEARLQSGVGWCVRSDSGLWTHVLRLFRESSASFPPAVPLKLSPQLADFRLFCQELKMWSHSLKY